MLVYVVYTEKKNNNFNYFKWEKLDNLKSMVEITTQIVINIIKI